MTQSSRRRAGTHRAPTSTRWRLLLGIALPLIVLTGAGFAIIGLPESLTTSDTADPITDTRLLGDDGASAPAPPGSDMVTQPAETPSSEEPESPSPEPEPSPEDPGDGPVDPLTALAVEATALTNQERRAAGCGEVVDNTQLAAAATGHSRDMADNGYFDHSSLDGRNFVDRAAAAGYDHAMSENIAKGYPDAASVIDGWMNSPGHRDNLLNCDAKAVGIGVARSADGSLLWTQMFGRR